MRTSSPRAAPRSRVLRVLDVTTGRGRRRADRPGALLPGGMAARRRGLLLRPSARLPTSSPTARSSSTAGSGCTASAPTPTPTRSSSATALDPTNYYGVTRQPRRSLARVSAPSRHRAAQRPLGGRPHHKPGREARPRLCPRRRRRPDRRCTSAATAASTSTPTATRPAVASWSPPRASGRSRTGGTLVPEDHDGGARRVGGARRRGPRRARAAGGSQQPRGRPPHPPRARQR